MIRNPITEHIYNKANENFQQVYGTRHWGQVLWNTAEDYIRKHFSIEIIEKFMSIKSTGADCYYSNNRVEKFVKTLDEIFEENSQE